MNILYYIGYEMLRSQQTSSRYFGCVLIITLNEKNLKNIFNKVVLSFDSKEMALGGNFHDMRR